MAPHTFRLMDPVSQRMMAVRADMTLQVARIATTRLDNAPRPLRLSYAGQVLRVRGSQLRPERQFGQAGIELIGVDNAAADAEVIALCRRSADGSGHDGCQRRPVVAGPGAAGRRARPSAGLARRARPQGRGRGAGRMRAPPPRPWWR